MSKGSHPEAGYDCCQVESIEVNVNPDPALDSFPEVATCKNGRNFLVAKSGWAGEMQDELFEHFPADAR